MTNCIISHLAPRDVKRRAKRKPAGKRAKRLKYQFKKRNGRKPRKSYERNKYMTHVLSYINDDAAYWDHISENIHVNTASFDYINQIAITQGIHMVRLLFGQDVVNAACKKEFAHVIKPNLTEELVINLDLHRLHVWLKLSKDLPCVVEDARATLVHSTLSAFSKKQLLALRPIMEKYPTLYSWEKANYGRKLKMGEKATFTVEDARKFVEEVESHKLADKLHQLSEVFEERTWNERIDNYYYEARETRWRASKCTVCGAEDWHTLMQKFSTTSQQGASCSNYHCVDCVANIMKENREQKRPMFSCGRDCKCFLKLDFTEGKDSYNFFAKSLDMQEIEVRAAQVEDFESVVFTPYKMLADKVAADPTNAVLGRDHRQFRNNCYGDHMDAISNELALEVEALKERIENLIQMGRLSTAVKTLDSAIKEVVSATLGKNDEEMLRTVKALKSPIQVVISNRPLEDEKAEKLFGISMLDIANSKLQRAKDVAKTAFSISKQCAICTTVVSQRGEEEELLTLHDNFDQDVSTWDSRTRLPCHACKDCFGNFMNFKSSLGRPMLRCPGMNCRCFLDKKRVEAAMPDAFAKFKDAMMRYSLKRVENYRTCPNADCSAGIVLDSCCKSDKVTCASCNWSFCPKCNDVPHEGMTCEELQRKRHEERWGKAKDYMANETKQCPYCLVWIEKNGGCNHMTCHHCRGEFCWLCFGEWKTHNSCEDKKPVVRRPFNELFPNWQDKEKKTLKARFHVGRYVTLEPHTEKEVGRVVSLHDNGMYHVKPAQIPGVESNLEGTLVVEESLMRGYNKLIPAENDALEVEEANYFSFLAGFDSETEVEAENTSVELTSMKDSEEKYISVELILKDASDASDSESGDTTLDDEDVVFFGFMKGFDDSDEEDSEDEDLLAKVNELDEVHFFGKSERLFRANREVETFKEQRKRRACLEKNREVHSSSDLDSDEEESEIAPAWLLFINADNDNSEESEVEEEESSAIYMDLGFESDDEESSS